MDTLKDIILTSIISPAIFEVLKFIIVTIKNKIKETSFPHTMNGFWCTFHESNVEDHSYSAYELLEIKQQDSKLYVRLYQLTDDERFYTYRGFGYIRGNKASISYEEIKSEISSSTGTITLIRKDATQHVPVYEGVYSEFLKEEKECVFKKYSLTHIDIEKKNIFLLILLKTIYAKKYMNKDSFKNVCKNSMR